MPWNNAIHLLRLPFRWKTMRIAGRCSTGIGLKCQSLATLQTSLAQIFHRLMSLWRVSRASRSHWHLVSGRGQKMNDLFGMTSGESLWQWDAEDCYWKTCQPSFITERPCRAFSQTLPDTGGLVSGTVLAVPKSAVYTNASDGSAGATPTWPTPTARDWKDGAYCKNVPINGLLGRAVWEAPTTQLDFFKEPSAGSGRLKLTAEFCEYLQGLPIGFTELKP
jgi:hypothetical protein